MTLVFRRTARLGRRTRANISSGGVSASRRQGPVTVSSRGRGSVRLLPGVSFRFKLWR
jgi:hypothetical protein